MNVENILKVANAIEQHSVPGMAFHMNYTYENHPSFLAELEESDKSPDQIELGHSCGSVGCIIGWTNLVIEPHLSRDFSSELSAAGHLGLDPKVAHALFYPRLDKGMGDRDYDSITPEQGVRVLRNLAETGKVIWDV